MSLTSTVISRCNIFNITIYIFLYCTYSIHSPFYFLFFYLILCDAALTVRLLLQQCNHATAGQMKVILLVYTQSMSPGGCQENHSQTYSNLCVQSRSQQLIIILIQLVKHKQQVKRTIQTASCKKAWGFLLFLHSLPTSH